MEKNLSLTIYHGKESFHRRARARRAAVVAEHDLQSQIGNFGFIVDRDTEEKLWFRLEES